MIESGSMQGTSHLNLAQRAVRGTLWVYASTYVGKFLVFLSTIILARLLLQEDFGIAGYALVVISFIEILQGLGIQAALIYFKTDADRLNTAFWLSLLIGLSLFLLTWFAAAPLAGWFFQDPRAAPVTRLLGLTFPISALAIVHDSQLRKELAFKRRFVPEFARNMGKGLIAVTLALLGLGYWSLIASQVAAAAIAVCVLWVIVPWRPTLKVRGHHASGLLRYGTNIVTVDALGILLNNTDYLLIGRFLGAAALGIYTLAFRVPEFLIKQFSDMVGKVTFPAYAELQDDNEALQNGFLITLRYSNMITIPLGLGLALVAEPFVMTFFGDKWIEAIPVMTAIALYTMLRALVFNTGDVYKAQGRPELISKIKIGQALVTLPALYLAVTRAGTITAVAWVLVFLTLIAAIVKLFIAGRVLELGSLRIALALRPSLVAGLSMSLAVIAVLRLVAGWSPAFELAIAVLVGGVVYLTVLWLLERGAVIQAGQTLRSALVNR
jgi:O-antigen/teichoic acid export membrane protein